LLAISPWLEIDPFVGLDKTAIIWERGRLLYAAYLASVVKLFAGEDSLRTVVLLEKLVLE
jgi:hypothetical protein